MSRDINFELPFPPSVNTYYRKVGNKMLISKNGREFKKQVGIIIGIIEPITSNVHISCTLCPPDKRKRDLDNYDGKALFDALTSAKVWLDDSQVHSRYSEWGSVVKGGKTFINIKTR